MALEAKLKGAAGRTQKSRWPHPAVRADVLDAAALALLDGALQETYGRPAPRPLDVSVRTRFTRVTLAHPERRERITVDRGLVVAVDGAVIDLGGAQAVVETKAERRSGRGRKHLLRHGHRPWRVSKYCLALTAVGGTGRGRGRRGNPWVPALRRLQPRGLDGVLPPAAVTDGEVVR